MTSPESIIPPHRTPAARAEKLIPAVLFVLAAICATGLVSLAVAAWPFAFGEIQWRVHFEATTLTAMPQLAFLLAMISVAGVYAGKHRAVRAAAAAFFALAGGLVVMVPAFALDFMSARHMQPQTTIDSFTREGLRLGAATAFLIPFLAWAGAKAWSAGKPDSVSRRAEGHGLVVGRPA
jgi:hypothetical protein